MIDSFPNLDVRKIPIGKLIPAEYHPRIDLKAGDKEYDKLMQSIEEFGYVEPIVWNEQTGNIVGGHQRLKVLQHLGYYEVDTVVVNMDEVREKALNVALNKISGKWDMPKLADVMRNLEEMGFNHEITGFDKKELKSLYSDVQKMRGEVVDDGFDTEKELESIEIPLTQLGDIWLLGNHRLMCSDSTNAEEVARLMGGAKAKMVFTDPPWNVDYGGAAHPTWKQRTILNDKMSTEDFYNFLLAAFKSMASVSLAGCPTYCVMSAAEWGNLMLCMKEAGYHWSSTIIWAKNSLIVSRKDYHTQYEPIWYGWLEGAARLCPMTEGERVDRTQSDLWQIDRPMKSPDHPTTKPLNLVGKAINNSSHCGDVVLDLFGGSGSTLLASEQTGRICCTMELDPKYADVIVNRYKKHMDTDDGVYLLRNGVKTAYNQLPQNAAPPQSEES
jgi:DNA modification methylase